MSKNINLLNVAYGLCISDFIFRSCNKLLSPNFLYKIFTTFDVVGVIGLFLALGALIFNGYFKNRMFIPIGILIASAAIVAFGPMYLLKFVQLFGYVLLYLGLALVWLLFFVQAFFGSTSAQKLKYLLMLFSLSIPVLFYLFRLSINLSTDLIGLAASLAICLLVLCSVLVKDPLIATGFILLLQPITFLSPALSTQGFNVLRYDVLSLMLAFISLGMMFYGVRRWNSQK